MSKYLVLAFIFTILIVTNTVWAQEETEPAGKSNLTNINLPIGAVRLFDSSVPADVNQALEKLVASADGKLMQGKREVLAWTGSNYKKSNAPVLIKQVAGNLQNSGWSYEIGGQNDGLTVFSVLRSTPTKRGLLGFYIFSENAFVLAWAEVLPVGSSNLNSAVNNSNNQMRPVSAPETVSASSAIVLDVEKNTGYVNLMGNQMPAMPQFPALSPKPERVRGYVKDWMGKPLAGATIGIRASYFAGMYSGAQGTTDAKGYYEFVVPKGSAHFYNAGYSMEWGDGGLAALGLHPSDGKLDSFTTADGAVENFVLLPYGLTSREKVQDNPFVPSSYYGGSIYINYEAFEASDNRPYAGSVPENSIIEITLASETGQSFAIRKTAGFQSLFRINNIPLGRYQISAKVNGKSLTLKQTGIFDQMFGMTPRETSGTASVLLAPEGAKAESVAPQAGGWKPINIKVQLQ